MPVQAFVDDSGGKGHSKHFVLCSLVTNSERWALFSDEWAAVLATPPSIDVFKMRDAANCSGAFYGFTEQERDDKLRALVRVINSHVEFLMYCMVDLSSHADKWAKLPKPMNDPYFWPFQVVIMGICFDLWDHKWEEKFEIFFDENLIFGDRARNWFPLLRDIIILKESGAAKLLPTEPLFRDDKQILPIQAADLCAWCFRRNNDYPDAQVFNWLLDEMKSVSQSKYCAYYDTNRMQKVYAESSHLIADGKIPADLMNKHRELLVGTRPTRNLKRNWPPD